MSRQKVLKSFKDSYILWSKKCAKTSNITVQKMSKIKSKGVQNYSKMFKDLHKKLSIDVFLNSLHSLVSYEGIDTF